MRNRFFAGYGDIVGVKVPPGRGCAFVQFVLRRNAELAINNMNGFLLCGSRVKLSWGKSTQSIQRPVGPPPPEYYQAVGAMGGGYGYAQQQQQAGYPQQGYASSMPGTPLTPTMGGDYSGQQQYQQQQQQQHNPQALHQAYYSPSGAHPPSATPAPPLQDPRVAVPVSEANAQYLDEKERVEAGTWVSSTWASQ